ncbi:MAG: hypothetical protein ACK55I_22150, partial [bacterium]
SGTAPDAEQVTGVLTPRNQRRAHRSSRKTIHSRNAGNAVVDVAEHPDTRQQRSHSRDHPR